MPGVKNPMCNAFPRIGDNDDDIMLITIIISFIVDVQTFMKIASKLPSSDLTMFKPATLFLAGFLFFSLGFLPFPQSKP